MQLLLPWCILLAGLCEDPPDTASAAIEAADEATLWSVLADRWTLSAELNYTDQSGNSALQVFSGGLNLSHQRREEFRFDLGWQSRYGRSEGEVVARNHRADLGVDLHPTRTWSPFLFSEAQRDPIRRLALRLSSGAGAKYTPFRTDDGAEILSVSLALLHSYEREMPEVTGDGGLEAEPLATHRARWSLRLRGRHDVREGMRIHYQSLYQPFWDELADYLLRSETGLRISLTERLALSMVYQWDRDSSPPSGVEPDDRVFRTGIILTL